jgi:hypothetical protein
MAGTSGEAIVKLKRVRQTGAAPIQPEQALSCHSLSNFLCVAPDCTRGLYFAHQPGRD